MRAKLKVVGNMGENAMDLGMDNKVLGRLIIVDDDEQVAQFYSRLFANQGFVVDLAKDLSALHSHLATNTYDAVLLDLELGREDGLEGLVSVLRESPSARVYILTAHGSVDRAVEAMRKGASGFFEKGSDPGQLLEELKGIADTSECRVSDLAQMGLIGQSPALQAVLEKIDRIREVDSTVLLLGESGTGKEVIARAIHRTSRRSKFRFSAINCGAIPEALLESELFGHKRGAFTDAKADRKGIFELSSSGTLLLDEIGDMPLSLQTKLLRVLQEREITPVGSSETIKIDTRIIAATHRDIFNESESKRFREDLYYRLSIIVLRIPALRERIEDIPHLVEHFLGIYKQKFNRDIKMPTASEMARITAYQWPGNIRELQNSMERAVVLSHNGRLNLEDVFAPLAGVTRPVNQVPEPVKDQQHLNLFLGYPLTDAKREFEKFYLEHHLTTCRGNVSDLAEKSGRYRADIYRLLNRYGIEHGEYRGH